MNPLKIAFVTLAISESPGLWCRHAGIEVVRDLDGGGSARVRLRWIGGLEWSSHWRRPWLQHWRRRSSHWRRPWLQHWRECGRRGSSARRLLAAFRSGDVRSRLGVPGRPRLRDRAAGAHRANLPRNDGEESLAE